jgi:hypothetical protein
MHSLVWPVFDWPGYMKWKCEEVEVGDCLQLLLVVSQPFLFSG